ncbi:MAG: 30S ribosomal protein S7 [Candidatus Diapherotrites archaeon]|uniref:30S ribosomal protein S7 n=1 Tax=Candidatus Iainarchaeum sp. TaxID=3101447 RepID=A0A7J4IZC2_9ARCH|nr:MAG: small subunit ribosomal protein S7 [archaeon GW2011_AR10]MBS3059568.1 30S ribosomal protein S7 [Candidatus Diapherotrites archaeon]HIH08316.1 30S ribosomal protein S7 [Candidatus Diapherotrites archaeon]
MLVFGKYETNEVQLADSTLGNYINLETKKFPHTFGRLAKKRFSKAEISIVERLVNKVMRSGQGKRKLSGKYIRGRGGTGKKIQAMQIVERAFDIVAKETKQNPIQVLVKAIENAGAREDITRIKRGGISYTVSVDVAPLKRVDESLKNIALAAFASSFNKKVSAEEALARELILASKEDNASFSIKRRDEVERIAKSSR